MEFRETLKGYHRDDVDEYLEKAAVEAEGLQEQLRQSTERLRKAPRPSPSSRPSWPPSPSPGPTVRPAEPIVADDTLQRTLLLAQKFVDETKADAEAQAARVVADAEARPASVQAESEQRLREEIARLESNRNQLSHEVETMSRQLESERERLRSALAEMLSWVDGNLTTVQRRESPVTDITGASAARARSPSCGRRAHCPSDPGGPGAARDPVGPSGHRPSASGMDRPRAGLGPGESGPVARPCND